MNIIEPIASDTRDETWIRINKAEEAIETILRDVDEWLKKEFGLTVSGVSMFRIYKIWVDITATKMESDHAST